MECTKKCRKESSPCQENSCRHWMDYEGDLNCSIISAEVNGPMTLEQISDRMGMTLVRVKQIQDAALVKLKKRISPLLHE